MEIELCSLTNQRSNFRIEPVLQQTGHCIWRIIKEDQNCKRQDNVPKLTPLLHQGRNIKKVFFQWSDHPYTLPKLMAQWSMQLFFVFFSLIAWNGFWQFFLFFPIFGHNSRILEKCLVVRRVYPPYTLSGPTTKKYTFLCVFPQAFKTKT